MGLSSNRSKDSMGASDVGGQVLAALIASYFVIMHLCMTSVSNAAGPMSVCCQQTVNQLAVVTEYTN